MSYEVIVAEAGISFPCRDGESVLAAMGRSPVACIDVGCRGGGCGVCRVQVLSGSFETGAMSQAQVGEGDRAQGIVLACQLFPRSDLRVRPLGRLADAGSESTAALIRRLCADARRELTNPA